MSTSDDETNPRSPTGEATVAAFLQHRLMDQASDYVSRGRQFSAVDVEALNNNWVDAFRTWVATMSSDTQALDDITAELNLRGLEPPGDRVEAEFAELSRRVKERLAQHNADDDSEPSNLMEEYGAFLRARDKPSA